MGTFWGFQVIFGDIFGGAFSLFFVGFLVVFFYFGGVSSCFSGDCQRFQLFLGGFSGGFGVSSCFSGAF